MKKENWGTKEYLLGKGLAVMKETVYGHDIETIYIPSSVAVIKDFIKEVLDGIETKESANVYIVASSEYVNGVGETYKEYLSFKIPEENIAKEWRDEKGGIHTGYVGLPKNLYFEMTNSYSSASVFSVLYMFPTKDGAEKMLEHFIDCKKEYDLEPVNSDDVSLQEDISNELKKKFRQEYRRSK